MKGLSKSTSSYIWFGAHAWDDHTFPWKTVLYDNSSRMKGVTRNIKVWKTIPTTDIWEHPGLSRDIWPRKADEPAGAQTPKGLTGRRRKVGQAWSNSMSPLASQAGHFGGYQFYHDWPGHLTTSSPNLAWELLEMTALEAETRSRSGLEPRKHQASIPTTDSSQNWWEEIFHSFCRNYPRKIKSLLRWCVKRQEF